MPQMSINQFLSPPFQLLLLSMMMHFSHSSRVGKIDFERINLSFDDFYCTPAFCITNTTQPCAVSQSQRDADDLPVLL